MTRRHEKKCSVAGCERPHAARGLCHKHYNQAWFAARRMGMGRRNLRGVYSHYQVDGCDRRVYAMGLCKKHYNAAKQRQSRARRAQNEQIAILSPAMLRWLETRGQITEAHQARREADE